MLKFTTQKWYFVTMFWPTAWKNSDQEKKFENRGRMQFIFLIFRRKTVDHWSPTFFMHNRFSTAAVNIEDLPHNDLISGSFCMMDNKSLCLVVRHSQIFLNFQQIFVPNCLKKLICPKNVGA